MNGPVIQADQPSGESSGVFARWHARTSFWQTLTRCAQKVAPILPPTNARLTQEPSAVPAHWKRIERHGAWNELPSLQFFDGTAHGAQRAQCGQSILGLFAISRVSGYAANRGRGCHDARFIFISSTVLEADVARFCQLSNGQAECSYLYRFTRISSALRDDGATEQTTSGSS